MSSSNQELTCASVTPASSEARVLADMYEDVRSITKLYLRYARDLDPHQVLEINGQRLNTLYWIMGHLVWAEHGLVVTACSGQRMEIPWLKEFEFGSQPQNSVELPSKTEILEAMDRVHDRAMQVILESDEEEMSQDNLLGFSFGGGKSKRVIIRHAIRHEALHSGHIGWIVKLNGIKTF